MPTPALSQRNSEQPGSRWSPYRPQLRSNTCGPNSVDASLAGSRPPPPMRPPGGAPRRSARARSTTTVGSCRTRRRSTSASGTGQQTPRARRFTSPACCPGSAAPRGARRPTSTAAGFVPWRGETLDRRSAPRLPGTSIVVIAHQRSVGGCQSGTSFAVNGAKACRSPTDPDAIDFDTVPPIGHRD
jgi:hypothetical protein